MEKKTSWDDIPSLEGLEVEWEFKPANPQGKRAFVRINAKDVATLFETGEIFIKIATTKATHTGYLLDISKGGLSLILPVFLEENLPVKVGFFLGTMKIISKALVRYSYKVGEQYKLGIQFVDLNKESAHFIDGLYASKILHHAPV